MGTFRAVTVQAARSPIARYIAAVIVTLFPQFNRGNAPAANVRSNAVHWCLLPAVSFEAILIAVPTRIPVRIDPKDRFKDESRIA